MTLHDAVVLHASQLCECELARRDRAGAVGDVTRSVTFAVAEWLAGPAARDGTVRRALEDVYLADRPDAQPPS